MLTKEQILQADDLKTQKVKVPEWGGEVLVKTMTGTERDSFEEAIFNNKGVTGVRARLAALTIVDAKGDRMFAEADIEALGKKSASALDRIFSIAQKINGFTDKDIGELEKN